MSIEVVSLGCRLNIAESEQMRAMLAEGGADKIVVVNSCAVTSEAVRQTRQAIRKARRDSPNARVIVTGCAAEVEREMLGAMPEVDGIVSNIAKLDPRAWNVEARPALRPKSGTYTRAFVQVQNGCDHSCTYCVIPQGRGQSRSRTVGEVISDVVIHLDAGVSEVVLTGVDLTSWGADLDGSPALGTLAAELLDAFPSLPRLRLSSIDGAEVDERLFDLLAFEPRMMPHVHLSLQSGDDMILKRMKRRHSRADAINLVGRLREHRTDLSVGADLIAGFPTEDDSMHANSLAMIAEIGIVHGHVFPFSPRPNTPAERMPQVDPRVARERAAELREAVKRERLHWLAGMIGTELSVLAEKGGTGHAANFAPVKLPAGTEPGRLITVVPKKIVEGMLA